MHILWRAIEHLDEDFQRGRLRLSQIAESPKQRPARLKNSTGDDFQTSHVAITHMRASL
jgi:hypothetical protein